MEGYCVKCKKKVLIKNPKEVTLKNGRKATQGTCPKCGTKVFRIGSMIRSKGLGRGLGTGKGKGSIGVPRYAKRRRL